MAERFGRRCAQLSSWRLIRIYACADQREAVCIEWQFTAAGIQQSVYSESGKSVQILSQVSLVLYLDDNDYEWELMELLRPLDEREGWIALPKQFLD